MGPDFAQCSATFASFSSNNSVYNFTGRPHGIFLDPERRPPLMTYEGCKNLCGSGNQYFDWADISSVITTWVFPVFGLLLQAPYESNKNWSTFLTLARWLGNPIAGMSYTFRNISVISRCALMVDMATLYDEVPNRNSQFAEIRDSFYLLSIMNQYTVKERMSSLNAAEKLLRVALFGDNSLQLTAADDRTDELVRTRRQVARFARIGRKKGVVEVFLSEALFVFALAISIYGAFGEIGSNETAHDLGIGLFMSWLAIFVLSSITDRNPVAVDEIRQQLNGLLELVRIALIDSELRGSYIATTGRTEDDFAWTKSLECENYLQNGFFTRFAGQGRVRWHNGCANTILYNIEHAWIADHGRGWMDDANRWRTRMVSDMETSHQELISFDRQMFWQIAGSTALLYGTTAGAFILAYFTPTVGLGCWSGGNTIYIAAATGIFAMEMLLWWFRTIYPSLPHWIVHYINFSFIDGLGVVLWLLELGNTGWLAYIIVAPTIGAYQNCECNCSIWTRIGGYMDFETYAYYRENGVKLYWGLGTGVSCLFLAVGLIYIVLEYCTQSHLSTEDYESAVKGLRTTRRFKKYTAWLGNLGWYLVKLLPTMMFGSFESSSNSLRWDWRTRDERMGMRQAHIFSI